MDFDNLIRAELIYDGGDEVRIPSGFEKPSSNQMQGTAHDRLGEIACRICYDSMGMDPETGKQKGRSSEKLHQHILEVKNYNVYEHAAFTVLFSKISHETLMNCFINRPGVWCERTAEGFEATMNHRCVLEWDQWKTSFGHFCNSSVDRIGIQLWNYAHTLAPHIYPKLKELDSYACHLIPVTDKLLPTQASISLYLSFSRGAGNEQCRHRFRMSQRSTRYVDESTSPYVVHPLITQFLLDEAADYEMKRDVTNSMAISEYSDKNTYNRLVECLQEYLKDKGVEGTQARKQARGAARGYLGIALHTEMIFTATVEQWRWIISQRATKLADAEIRILYSTGDHSVLNCLKDSRYGDYFEDFKIDYCPDSIGNSLV